MAPPRNGKHEPLNSWGWVTESTKVDKLGIQELIQVYRLGAYQDCECKRKNLNCKKNPYCLWGLGDSPWTDQDDNTLDTSLENQERDEGELVGLQNLGATCYVNSLLQLWYHNPILRPAILRWKPHDMIDPKIYVPQSAVSHLQAMFARMKTSKQRTIDTKPLVAALSLDSGVQQDAQEFSKLLLACITRQIEESAGNEEISSIFKNCFSGESLFQTTCVKCRNVTYGRKEEFNELQLSVNPSLASSFDEYFIEERLEGDNQYFCINCNSKQDAIRKMRILKLPQVLNIQLMRFVYDKATHGKKKILSPISFPEILDMTGYLDPEAVNGVGQRPQLIYHLNAVLIHNGKKATSGHYISHIKDLATGGWFECNDETVAKLGSKCYSQTLTIKTDDCEVSENGSTSETKATTSAQPSTSSTQIAKKGKNNKEKDFLSKGAYMLVYTRQEFTDAQPDPEFPDFLLELVKREDAITEAKNEEKRLIKAKDGEKRNQRQEEIITLFNPKYLALQQRNASSAPSSRKPSAGKENGWFSTRNPINEFAPSKPNTQTSTILPTLRLITPATPANRLDKMDFISVQWLTEWLQYNPLITELTPILNADITCRHGKLKPPRKSDAHALYKVIPSEFADKLYNQHNGFRLTGKTVLCMDCVQTHCKFLMAQLQLDIDHKKFDDAVRKYEEITKKYKDNPSFKSSSDTDLVLVGRESFNKWKKVAKSDLDEKDKEIFHVAGQVPVKKDGDNNEEAWNFNQELKCEHGHLSVNRKDRKLVDLNSFMIVCQYFPQAIMLGINHPDCEYCEAHEKQNKEAISEYKELANTEKNQLLDLFKSFHRPSFDTPGIYSLIPASFLRNWISFIRNPANGFQESINTHELLCDCVNCGCVVPSLKYPMEKIGTVFELDEKTYLNYVAVIKPTELAILAKFRELVPEEIKVRITENPLESNSYLYDYFNKGICEKSAEDWVQEVVLSTYEYSKGEITIRKIEDDEAMEINGNSPNKKLRSDPEVRRSQRQRSNRDERKYQSIRSDYTIRELQIKFLVKDFNAGLSDQHLFFGDRELTSEDKKKSFSELRIPNGGIIFIKVDKPNSEEEMEVEESSESRNDEPEKGFSGTALLSGVGGGSRMMNGA